MLLRPGSAPALLTFACGCGRVHGTPGRRHPGARHYFDCGGVVLAVLDVTEGGMRPTPGPKSIYFAVEDIDKVHTRAKSLNMLPPFQVHGQPRATWSSGPGGSAHLCDRPMGQRAVLRPGGHAVQLSAATSAAG